MAFRGISYGWDRGLVAGRDPPSNLRSGTCSVVYAPKKNISEETTISELRFSLGMKSFSSNPFVSCLSPLALPLLRSVEKREMIKCQKRRTTGRGMDEKKTSLPCKEQGGSRVESGEVRVSTVTAVLGGGGRTSGGGGEVGAAAGLRSRSPAVPTGAGTDSSAVSARGPRGG